MQMSKSSEFKWSRVMLLLICPERKTEKIIIKVVQNSKIVSHSEWFNRRLLHANVPVDFDGHGRIMPDQMVSRGPPLSHSFTHPFIHSLRRLRVITDQLSWTFFMRNWIQIGFFPRLPFEVFIICNGFGWLKWLGPTWGVGLVLTKKKKDAQDIFSFNNK